MKIIQDEHEVHEQVSKLFNQLPHEAWIDPSLETAKTRLAIVEKTAKLVNRLSYKLKKLANERTAFVEYCRGRDILPRGYYCPNPLSDIIVSGFKRGKVTKKKPSSSPYYVYHFSNENELLMIEEIGTVAGTYDRTELLFRFDQYRVGFCFVENIEDSERYIDVTVECKTDIGDKYIISLYTVIKKNGSYQAEEGEESKLITLCGGLPVKLVEIHEEIDLSEEMRNLLGIKNWEYNIRTREFEVLYDESGFPFECKCKGDTFKPGNVRKPVLSGMF